MARSAFSPSFFNACAGQEDTALPLLVPEQALGRMDNDKALYIALGEVFLQDTPVTLRHLFQALAQKNFEAAMRHAHGVKGASATVGANRLSALAREIECSCRSQTPLSPAQEQHFHSVWLETKQALSDFLHFQLAKP